LVTFIIYHRKGLGRAYFLLYTNCYFDPTHIPKTGIQKMATTAQTQTESAQYEKYRKPIQDIIDFTDTLDVEYREKCFEVLLNYHLSGGVAIRSSVSVEAPKKDAWVIEDLSGETKIFLEQNKISEQVLSKLFVKEKGEIHPIYKITEPKRPKAQIQLALLTAFERALKGASGTFEFSVSTVRQRCMDIKMYDGRDFFINFMDSAGLFVSLNSYEVIKLSEIGKAELVKIVAVLSK
jgi:hypothetical protein